MKGFLFAAVFGALSIFLLASSAVAQDSEPWQKRCNANEQGEATEQCEIFQKLVVTESGARFMEMAVGFPEGSDNAARGVIILPLGILLENGVQMSIDDGQVFKFNVRYCDQGGCVAFVSLNEQLLQMMRRGNNAQINFTGATGQPYNVVMTLNGFTAAINQL